MLIVDFHRVCPDVTLVDLKDEVSKQLDSNLLPESYIFLRNVGHRLTFVSLQYNNYCVKLHSILSCTIGWYKARVSAESEAFSSSNCELLLFVNAADFRESASEIRMLC